MPVSLTRDLRQFIQNAYDISPSFREAKYIRRLFYVWAYIVERKKQIQGIWADEQGALLVHSEVREEILELQTKQQLAINMMYLVCCSRMLSSRQDEGRMTNESLTDSFDSTLRHGHMANSEKVLNLMLGALCDVLYAEDSPFRDEQLASFLSLVWAPTKFARIEYSLIYLYWAQRIQQYVPHVDANDKVKRAQEIGQLTLAESHGRQKVQEGQGEHQGHQGHEGGGGQDGARA
jgi:hypothetical protein